MVTCDLAGEPDPEDIGPVIPDPWEDPAQEDWPMHPEGGTDGLGTDSNAGESPEPAQQQVPKSE
jgi:hypothetical protein